MLSLNTHHYDGRLAQIKKELLPDLIRISKLSAEDKITQLHTLSSTLSSQRTSSQESRDNISRIIGDYINTLKRTSPIISSPSPSSIMSPSPLIFPSSPLTLEKDNNYEPSNDLHTEDLLYYLSEAIANLEPEDRNNILDLTNYQLKEMSSGFCPQGRAYRLLQVVNVARDLLFLKSNITI